MVEIANLTTDEIALVNSLIQEIEEIVNKDQQWRIETILEAPDPSMTGMIQAFLSLIITNYDYSLGQFRIYPRFIKKLQDDRILVQSTTLLAPNQAEEITWQLTRSKDESFKFKIEDVNTNTISIYAEPKREKTPIPKMKDSWIKYMRTREYMKVTNKIYLKLKEEKGKKSAIEFFNDKEEFKAELDNLFGFLEGPFKIVAYIAILGMNIFDWKGVILKEGEQYRVIFDEHNELKVLEKMTPPKLTEEEYLELRQYQWDKRVEDLDLKLTIEFDYEKQRVVYKVKKVVKYQIGERERQEMIQPKDDDDVRDSRSFSMSSP